MVEHGERLLGDALKLAERVRQAIEAIPGMHVNRDEFVAPGRAFDLDPLQVIIDIEGMDGVTGYRAADWVREHHAVNLHLSDHRRISAQLTFADDEATADALLAALRDLSSSAGTLRGAPAVDVPTPEQLRLDQAALPRDAFFGPAEQVPADEAVGRVCAEMLTPYPPGIPAVMPGERIERPVLDYLRSGVRAGMSVPDAADSTLASVRVTIET
ncbi:arginine/lysine/ornithine decarboxylase [Actinomadura rupiterrae]|nr:arginine/lysine/ornithine decarboxylase [Actinomadura rupiterrae]